MKLLNSKLRIAIVLDKFTPSKGGESYFSWLIRELSLRGHEVHVFTALSEKRISQDFRLHIVPVLKYPRSLRILSFLMNFAHAAKHYKFHILHGVGRVHAINIFNPHGGVEKAYVKQDLSSITNTLYFVYKLLKRYISAEHYIKVWIQKKQYANRNVKKIIAISKMVKDDVMRYYRVPEEKISIVTNCVDLERFHPKNRRRYRTLKRRELGIDEKTLVLLFAGNNYRLKGLRQLLGALASLRLSFPNQSICLLVAGRGQVRRYARLASKLGVRGCTTFLGAVQGMEQYYAASDIYVHPTFYDPCSLTVLEALASGLPTITTRFNGAADVITSEKGGKVIDDPGNIEDLVQSIAFFFDTERRDEARIVARRWMESYSPDRHFEKILEIYREVAEEH